MSQATSEKKPNIVDSFMIGARSGFNIAINAMLPGVIFAFMIMQFLNITGLVTYIEIIFHPVMSLLGLPGVAITPILFSFITTSGSLGAVVSLIDSGQITLEHVCILTPALMLTGAMIQYMGRVLGAAGVSAKFYPYLMGLCVLNSILSMLIMRFIILSTPHGRLVLSCVSRITPSTKGVLMIPEIMRR